VQARDAVVARLVELGEQFRADPVGVDVVDLGEDFVLRFARDDAGAGQAQQHALLEVQQRDDLLQQAAGEVFQIALLENMRRRGDDALEARASIRLVTSWIARAMTDVRLEPVGQSSHRSRQAAQEAA